MKTWDKIWSHFKAVITIMITICMIIGIDYEELNNTKNILIYCFIVSNGILASFYFIQEFYHTITDKENK